MNEAKISIISSMAGNRAIGKGDRLLWRISEDLKHFRELTSGHPVIMGRKTFESIGFPLPNRTNIIITRKHNYQKRNCLVAHSLEEAINEGRKIDQKEIFIIGGGEIYQQAILVADKLYLTLVEGDYEADTFFPEYGEFKKVIYEGDQQKEGKYKFKFIELTRR